MKKLLVFATFFVSALLYAQVDTLQVLEEVSIQSKSEGIKRMSGAVNGTEIGQDELFRAACCNLGESFVTNPAVDVNYSDAAVGARQIRLLGLGGQYVQMLVEGLPMAGGAAQPYLLGRVPGTWMKSIQVSKGAASVKNGPQSITGQIDVEYIKPDDDQTLFLNLYGDSHSKTEANMVLNKAFGRYFSAEAMLHYENQWMHHDMNEDGWIDMPLVRQWNSSIRTKYRRGRYLGHYGVNLFSESRLGGTMQSWPSMLPGVWASLLQSGPDINLLGSGVGAYMKHAILLDREHNTNLALTATWDRQHLHGRMWQRDTLDGKMMNIVQSTLNTQLMLEHDFTEAHQLSAGLSFTHEGMEETYLPIPRYDSLLTEENTPGLYAQYTYKPSYRFTAMAGLRADYSTLYGMGYVTPRLHLKWTPADWLTLRSSAGKGYRTTHPFAEYHYLAASGRPLVIDADLPMEEAWNTGLTAVFYIPVGGRTITLNTEFYYTTFLQQTVLDYDSDPTLLHITSLNGRSFSRTLQVDASYNPSDEWSLVAAFRLNDVHCTYGGILMEKPLQSRYKGLVTVSWEPMMALWHVDLTLQLCGPGRMPTPAMAADGTPLWEERFPAYPQLNLQLTRDFRHCSVYIGGENLTGYRQPVPVVDAAHPWSADFDPTMLWGPVHGVMIYAGVRLNFWRL